MMTTRNMVSSYSTPGALTVMVLRGSPVLSKNIVWRHFDRFTARQVQGYVIWGLLPSPFISKEDFPPSSTSSTSVLGEQCSPGRRPNIVQDDGIVGGLGSKDFVCRANVVHHLEPFYVDVVVNVVVGSAQNDRLGNVPFVRFESQGRGVP